MKSNLRVQPDSREPAKAYIMRVAQACVEAGTDNVRRVLNYGTIKLDGGFLAFLRIPDRFERREARRAFDGFVYRKQRCQTSSAWDIVESGGEL